MDKKLDKQLSNMFENLTQGSSDGKQIDTMQYRIAKKNRQKARKLFKKILLYQKNHPEIYTYNRTRVFVRESKDYPDDDIWLCIDEYIDRKAYGKSLTDAFKNNPESASHFYDFYALIEPGQEIKHEAWTQIPELEVNFK